MATAPAAPTGPVTGKLSAAAIWLTIGAVVLLALPGLLFRLGFGFQFMMLTAGTFVAIGAVVLSLIALVWAFKNNQKKTTPILALLASGAAALFMMSLASQGRSVPAIHDITTDTNNPPEFVAAGPVRDADGAANPIDYDPEIAAQQLEAYPDLRTLNLDVSPGEAFRRAEAAVEGLGWDVIETDAATGRIEATESSLWFGFKDDVVVRVQSDGATGSLVDVRSKSRIGLSDLGANAARIERLLAAIEAG